MRQSHTLICVEAACAAHPTADVFINFASSRSAFASSMSALKQPTIRGVAIIAEGVPESDTKQLISYAKTNNKESQLEEMFFLALLFLIMFCALTISHMLR